MDLPIRTLLDSVEGYDILIKQTSDGTAVMLWIVKRNVWEGNAYNDL